jgi:hypothetical protein
LPAGWCRATLDATPATTADCPQVGSRKPILNHQTRQKVEPRVTTDAVLNFLHSTCQEMKKMSVNVAGNKPLPCRKTLCPAETYSRKVFSRCAERRVYQSVPYYQNAIPTAFFPVFLSCAIGMTLVICVSLFAIYVGPLFGIIQENSTFGEVVRAGDSKRRRWFRMRPHIQRPSEIAFFYENRSEQFRRWEGLIRWGIGFCGLTLVSIAASAGLLWLVTFVPVLRGGNWPPWFRYEVSITYLTIHGVGLVLAMLLFSHGKNSAYLRIPVFRGRMTEVSRLASGYHLLSAVCDDLDGGGDRHSVLL